MSVGKIAAVLAVVIGGLAVLAGGRVVMLGKTVNYYVINWLPIYNFIAGLLSVFVIAALIWTNHKFAVPAALIIFAAHSIVMVILQIAYRGTAAIESMVAMTIRIITWSIILLLMFIQARKG